MITLLSGHSYCCVSKKIYTLLDFSTAKKKSNFLTSFFIYLLLLDKNIKLNQLQLQTIAIFILLSIIKPIITLKNIYNYPQRKKNTINKKCFYDFFFSSDIIFLSCIFKKTSLLTCLHIDSFWFVCFAYLFIYSCTTLVIHYYSQTLPKNQNG